MSARPRVGIIGGGISGLAAAHRLTRRGVPVVLLEGSDQLGGLGTFFRAGEEWIERFYHCIMPTDAHLLAVLAELGLADSVEWRKTRMGLIVDNVRYPFNTAADLLRFRPLTLPQRVRLGVVSVLLRRLGEGKDLDNIRTEEWLRGLYGDAIWERLFRGLFASKFGPAVGDVPALYLWQRMGREKNVSVRGYPDGGYKSIIEGLRASIEAGGGLVRTRAPVSSLSASPSGCRMVLPDGTAVDTDWVVSTAPLPLLRRVADAELSTRLPTIDLRYQGVVNAVFFLDRPLEGRYWSPVLDSGTEFDGVVDMSALTGTTRHGHLVYTMRYTDRSSALFAEDERAIAERWSAQLLALYPDLRPEILDVRIFKAPFVEPVYPLGYAALRPPVEIPGTRLLLATSGQVYPNVTSWNSSVGLANEVVDGLLARPELAPRPAQLAGERGGR
ncbi:FAD-dependent oxidoreductase [Pseudonocardia acaciae]|uniref:FAD-dependent oxidoreductase n=1 Tax=Pseudonocardia acaciae TaxID=551276 RepID=UPI00048E195D|nr:FAD-dependent oxidoreductase [Pseudonocardia acaciae]